MKKNDFLMVAAVYLIAMLVAGIHRAVDKALGDALATGNTVLMASATNWQWSVAAVEVLLLLAIIGGIKRDISRNARAAS